MMKYLPSKDLLEQGIPEAQWKLIHCGGGHLPRVPHPCVGQGHILKNVLTKRQNGPTVLTTRNVSQMGGHDSQGGGGGGGCPKQVSLIL